MEMDGKIITTTDEARQAIVDLYVEGIEKEFTSKIERKICDIAQEFGGLSGPSTMRLSRIKAEKIVEEKKKQQDIFKKIETA